VSKPLGLHPELKAKLRREHDFRWTENRLLVLGILQAGAGTIRDISMATGVEATRVSKVLKALLALEYVRQTRRRGRFKIWETTPLGSIRLEDAMRKTNSHRQNLTSDVVGHIKDNQERRRDLKAIGWRSHLIYELFKTRTGYEIDYVLNLQGIVKVESFFAFSFGVLLGKAIRTFKNRPPIRQTPKMRILNRVRGVLKKRFPGERIDGQNMRELALLCMTEKWPVRAASTIAC